jgi:hypothetical protein
MYHNHTFGGGCKCTIVVHSNLSNIMHSNIMHVTTKVKVTLKRLAGLTWMHDNRE